MIKNSCHIRAFSPEQKSKLEVVAKEQGLKNATDVFFFVLDNYTDLKNENARLKRFNDRKQEKIDELKKQIE